MGIEIVRINAGLYPDDEEICYNCVAFAKCEYKDTSEGKYGGCPNFVDESEEEYGNGKAKTINKKNT